MYRPADLSIILNIHTWLIIYYIILIIHTRLIIFRCVNTLICIDMKIGWTDIQTFEAIGWSTDGHVSVALTASLQTYDSP